MNNKYKNSRELLKRAKKITPLGAQTFSKSYRYFCEGNSPSFMEKGKGAHVWDVDENKYIDFICGLGPVTLGYNDQRINEAITKQMEKGIIFSQPAPISIELSEKLIEIIPCAEMVRFVKNGSDATSAAVRLARAYTERDIIATCGYHGMQDWYIGSTVNNKGVPQKVCELSQSFDYNNIESLESLFAKYPNKIAAVILEPIQSNGPEEGYLQKVKEIAQDNGAVLIFDEVVSGFRYALGGASELYSVTPDLVTLGKGMANGMPISAVAGKKELLNLISDGVFISTTFGGEALSIAAALETINILQEKNACEEFWRLGDLMLEGLQKLIDKHDMKKIVELSGLAPRCGLVFEGGGNLDYLDINSLYQQRMIEEGILTIGINNISLSHTEKDIELFLKATESSFIDIKKAIEKDSLDGVLMGGKVNPIFKRNIK